MNITFPRRSDRRRRSRPLVAWALVLAATLLSFFVHLLNEQMHRVAALRAVPGGPAHGSSASARAPALARLPLARRAPAQPPA